MPDSKQNKEELEGQKQEAEKAFRSAAKLLRNAIRDLIPVSNEQYLTISVPGTVIDTRDNKKGGAYVYDGAENVLPPFAIRQAEARLVDNMLPLSSIMMGNTGKSVAHSYSRALDTLVVKKATMKSGNAIRAPGEATYDAAMSYLTKVDEKTKKTPIDVYIEKQKIWADAQSDWDTAKIEAEQRAKEKYPNDHQAALEAFEEWNQEHFRSYKYTVQGAYMDWVTNGNKYEVERNFGIVDVDSIMARVEQSKETLRDSTIADFDGSSEIQGVQLTPKNWATICQQKVDGWFKRNGNFTLDQITAEIDRLVRLEISYECMYEAITGGETYKTIEGTDAPDSEKPKLNSKGEIGDPPTETKTTSASTEQTYPLKPEDQTSTTPETTKAGWLTVIKDAFKALYEKEGAMNKFAFLAKEALELAKNTEGSEYQVASAALDEARLFLENVIKGADASRFQWDKHEVATLPPQSESRDQTIAWLKKDMDEIEYQIEQLKAVRTKKADPSNTDSIYQPVVGPASGNKGRGAAASKVSINGTKANPKFGIPDKDSRQPINDNPEANPWTTIAASFSASDQQDESNSKSSGFSTQSDYSWWWWGAGGGYSSEDTQSDSTSDMVSCSVSVTFDCLVVNITRPWLFAELFNDFELDVAQNIKLSPGAKKIKTWVENEGRDDDVGNLALANLAQYDIFPSFPTSFLIAADTVLEFTGNTQHIEQHYKAHSDQGSFGWGWGPWGSSTSWHDESQSQSMQMHSTATGCKIQFGAPQIIGWISQIIPQLPRDPHYNTTTQDSRDHGQPNEKKAFESFGDDPGYPEGI
ncbi:hypothetical protein TWF718_002751 [Orbilia javanica]|uniref:Uncharacterized protein n=1 Tax=Orbilia javanica TaxID=47235 RepID=A0AAN8MGM9_9PEZI